MVWMAKLTRDAQFDPELRALAERIVKGVFGHDYPSEYAAVLNWVRRNVRYVRDPRSIEQVKTPRVVVETGSGDCDDLSVLAATLCSTLGAQTRFVAGAFKASAVGQPVLSHVWAEAYDPNSKAWLILDPVPGKRVAKMIGRLISTKVVSAID